VACAVAGLLLISALPDLLPQPLSAKEEAALRYLQAGPRGWGFTPPGDPRLWGTLLGWLMTNDIGKMVHPIEFAEISRSWLDEWRLDTPLYETLKALGGNDEEARRLTDLVRLLISHHPTLLPVLSSATRKGGAAGMRPTFQAKQAQLRPILQSWLADPDVQRFLGFNRYQGILWFNREAFEEWLWWIYAATIVQRLTNEIQRQSIKEASQLQSVDRSLGLEIVECFEVIQHLLKAAEAAAYQVEKLLDFATEFPSE